MGHLELLRHLPFVRVAEPIRFPAGTGAGNRTAQRRVLITDVELSDTDDVEEPLPLELNEVSATGAFVASDLLLPVGAPVDLTFILPTGDRRITVRGRVVRVEERGLRPGMGIEFDRMDADDRANLRAYTLWN